jgi:hypothetical protein
VNALVVADSVIIPIDSSSFALLGMNQLLKTIAAISETHNPALKILLLTTLYDRRQNLDRLIRREVEQFFGSSLVMESVIHRYVGVAEATAMRKGVVESSTTGAPSPTRELLKHYSPLEGIVTGPETDDSLLAEPVENTMAPDATLAPGASPAWHRATVARHATLAPHTTVERYAIVKGELRVPNTLNFSVFPHSIRSPRQSTTSCFFFPMASGETPVWSAWRSWRNQFSCPNERSRTQSLTSRSGP